MRERDGMLRALGAYGAAAVASIAASVYLLELRDADLRVPFNYSGDGLLHSFVVRTALDHGWIWFNPDVGAPGGLELYDFPMSAHDAAHLLLLKAMALVTHDWALVFNLYFLLGFPLITLSAMAVFRRFQVGYAAAAVGAILYAFLPSRLIKGESHLFLDTFFQVPVAVLLLLLVCGDDPPLFASRERGPWPRLAWRERRSWGALLACALIASTSLYYAFFTACLFAAGGAWASIERRSTRNAAAGAALAALIGVGIVALGLPTIVYHLRHGPNHQVSTRAQWEAEYYGMKIAQLLLPVDLHRIPVLRQLKDHYTGSAPFVGENGTTSLGVVGGVGFLVLLGAVIVRRAGARAALEPIRRLAVLNWMAVLLGTIGGFGSLFAVLVSPQIRTYSRLNVFIGFFGLFVVVLLLDRLRRAHPRVALGALPAVLVIGLLDQATPAAVRPYAQTRRQYASDGDFVHRLEAILPPGSAIFQLPHANFPEGPTYEPLRPYLHSHTLRWSEPQMFGRPGNAWVSDMAQRPPDAMVDALARAGFAGILIDREAYPARPCGEEDAFRLALDAKPIASADGRYVFFSLAECAGGGCSACGRVAQACCPGDRCRAGLLCQGGACTCGDLQSGQSLGSAEAMASCDGRFTLSVHEDGDLVVSGCGCRGEGESCWRSGTTGITSAALTMQSDGNLVLYGKGCTGPHESCWSTNTVGHPGAHLALQEDGNLCVLGGGCLGGSEACWCSGAPAPAPPGAHGR